MMRSVDVRDAADLPLDALLADGRPALLKGVASDWGLVHAGRVSTSNAMAYLRGFDAGRPVPYSYGAPSIQGRPFYNDDFTALNVEVRRGGLGEVLDAITQHFDDASPPTYYLASLPVAGALPGFIADNDLGLALGPIQGANYNDMTDVLSGTGEESDIVAVGIRHTF